MTLDRPWLLLCYTDGLVEGRRSPDATERFGIERLAATVQDLCRLHPEPTGLLDRLLTTVQATNGGQLSDDVAIVCLTIGR